ncbi:MAG: helix-turn-helix transcriptional regulator [Eubacterium sp.]|nr:helix-turn-helix transcriptional regulator [Eubacterium sp.]
MFESKTVIDMEMTGNNLRKYANAFGYSVKDIQQYLGLSCPQPVYRWFKGKILPSVDNLLRLSELFHVHMENLLVKQHAQCGYEYYSSTEENSFLFLKRMQAYYSLMAA